MTANDILTTGGKYPERPRDYPPTADVTVNAGILALRVERLFGIYAEHGRLLSAADFTSGYRPAAVNARVANAAPRSSHILGAAVDVGDPDGTFGQWCLANTSALALCGLWLEHPRSTHGWVHLQCVPPPSHARIFNV